MENEGTKSSNGSRTAGLIAGVIAGAGIASLALILLTRATRAESPESVELLLHQCDDAAEKLDHRLVAND